VTQRHSLALALLLLVLANEATGQCFTCADAPPGTIFCDDFETTSPLTDRYFEVDSDEGDLIIVDNTGRNGGRAVRIRFQAGEVGAGGLKKSFGDAPGNYFSIHKSRADTSFDEIYWRMDVRHQPGWQGNGPAKLSRVISFVDFNWVQGVSAHLWSGGMDDKYLLMDPATGIDTDGNVKSTKYNDFSNWRWLGYKPGSTPMFDDANAGTWYCVVGHVKLNTPGQSDGVFEFWINDTLQTGSYNLNWHGDYNSDPNAKKLNAVFFENYWNDGSPIEQERYFDNLVIGSKPVTCDCKNTTDLDTDDMKLNESERGSRVLEVRYFNVLGRELTLEEIQSERLVIVITLMEHEESKTSMMLR